MAIASTPPRLAGVPLNIALFVGAALIGNGLIFATGSAGGAPPPGGEGLIPPGPVVGAVWLVQFALMGTARAWLLADGGPREWRAWLPVVLAVLCLAFPVYTRGLSDPSAGAVGTLATLAVTVPAMVAIGGGSSRAAWALVPLACWLGYVAAVYFLAGMGG